jgi:TolB-like protein/DNA-binding winged helix-turn-helix (wHTH) protein/Tfp pilus assembly protein PilF
MADPQQTKHFHTFGSFLLDPVERVLLRDGEPLALTPKSFETLLTLVENSGHIVAKDELLRRVWPDTFVEEATLAQNVFTLRKALGDSPEGHLYIETVPKRGYRFTARVQVIEQTSARRAPAPGAAPVVTASHSTRRVWFRILLVAAVVSVVAGAAYVVGRRSGPRNSLPAGRVMLAVLPFQNLSGDPQQEYLSDGLTEEMITQLGRMNSERLGVIARTSTMRYRNTPKSVDQIGRELGVSFILEGSVRRTGDHVRISAQLIQVKDQTHLWAENYDRDLRDVLALQSDVARAIAHEIAVNLTPQQQNRLASARPVDREAYDLYLKGRYFWNKRSEDGFTKAIEYFQQAIAQDANYAQAYAGLADAYALLGSMPNAEIPRKEAMPLARTAALKALQIDESLAEAHTSLAFVRMHYDWDWPGAEKEFQRAIELNPDYATAQQWHAYDLMVMGRTEESLAEIHRAQELDPLSLIINTDAVELMYCARRYDEAIRQGRKTIDMDPGFALVHEFMGLVYLQMKQYTEAIAELQEGFRLSGNRIDFLSCSAIGYALVGRTDEARQILQELKKGSTKRFDMPIYLSRVYRDLGEKDQALFWLEKAYQERDGSLILLQVDPGNDPLRSDRRFQDLLRRVGLTPWPVSQALPFSAPKEIIPCYIGISVEFVKQAGSALRTILSLG